jgi:GDP-L-fucose synthase
MLSVMENYYECDPVNLGCGKPVTIKEVVEIICRNVRNPPQIRWDTSKPTGNKIRLMDTTKARERAKFTPAYSLEQGIKETIDWVEANPDHQRGRFKVFWAT